MKITAKIRDKLAVVIAEQRLPFVYNSASYTDISFFCCLNGFSNSHF